MLINRAPWSRTIVDLFAGTGGMGLASLTVPFFSGTGQIVFTGELEQAYVESIEQNYAYYANKIGEPEQLPSRVTARDVVSNSSLRELSALRRRHKSIDLLLAGPPCQGFSKSNAMSRDSANPRNQLALDTVFAIGAALPKVAIIENVPGIQTMPSPRSRRLTVSEHIESELFQLGYHTETRLLDAAAYGVPQRRLRSFTIAVHKAVLDFFNVDSLFPEGEYGPGRKYPYRTVRDALSDLPDVDNGCTETERAYGKAALNPLQRQLRKKSEKLFDHVTTRHAEYVLKRFEDVPCGGNWTSIRDSLHNYSVPENTHTNIYHRLHPDRPAKTIGNFRKAMTIHPWQDRGLSLREAARLQSIPDWIRFFDPAVEVRRGQLRGMSDKQQQIGNAVCYQLTAKLVSHLFS